MEQPSTLSLVDGVRIAVAQVEAEFGALSENLALAERLVQRAAARRAHLLVLPECFLQGYGLRAHLDRLAERPTGPAMLRLSSLASRHGVAMVAGFIEHNQAVPSRPYNSAAILDRDGTLLGVYRKTHLFGDEGSFFSAGDAYPVFALALRRGRPRVPVGAAICADIEYPEVIRLLAINGAQIIAVPSADMEPFRAQQAANLRSRAIENNVYVALSNTVGTRDGLSFFGGSGVASPMGRVVSAGYTRQRLTIAELRTAEVEASGGVGAYLRRRRLNTYGGLLGDTVADIQDVL